MLLDAVVDFGFRDSLAVVIVVTGFTKTAVWYYCRSIVPSGWVALVDCCGLLDSGLGWL